MDAFNRKLRKAEKHLSAACPQLGAWISEQGRCQWEPVWVREPFESLVRAVAHQQLHGKAAESILRRLVERFPDQGFPTALQLSRMRVPSYRKCGFSLAKTEAIRGIARGTMDGRVPNRALADKMTEQALVESLTELKGIGKWTVEMFLIFTLGRMDIMPIDDFGIRAGLMHLIGLERLPKKADFVIWTDSWQPYRSVGAWYLWRMADARK